MTDSVLLTLLWLVPLAGSLLVLAIPRSEAGVKAVKAVSLAVTLAAFAISLVIAARYLDLGADGTYPPLARRAAANIVTVDPSGFGTTKVEDAPNDLVVRLPWIPYFNIQYYLGVDGISLSLVVLTTLVSVLACLASFTIPTKQHGYFSLYLLLVASMLGVFLALDLFLFYVFFEVMLLPMYFLIGIWGGPRREYAAIKFLLYTLFGSVFVLVGVLILYFWTGAPGLHRLADGSEFHARSFDALLVARAATETGYYEGWIQSLVFLLFFIGFAVKLPSVPFHTWLPDAHVEAPTPISMILAGILLKIGGYGWLRFAWPLAPLGAMQWSWWIAALGVFSILYGALAAMGQTDFKKLVAYSSVSHMGYVTLGLAAMNLIDPRFYAYGVNGAMYMMIAHGITSTGMFFLVGVIYERAHTRDLNALGGLFTWMPCYAAVSFLIFFGSLGLPTLCGFVAEIFVVMAAFSYNRVLAVLAAAAVILTAGYILWTLQRVFLGKNETYKDLPDLTPREWTIAVPLVVLTIVLGILPQQAILSWMSPSVDHVVKQVVQANDRAGLGAPRPAEAVVLAAKPTAGHPEPDLTRE
jgi:NADH-quinone oxidoreductase subunit M